MKIAGKLVAERIQTFAGFFGVILFIAFFLLSIYGILSGDFDFTEKLFKSVGNIAAILGGAIFLAVIAAIIFSLILKNRYKLKTTVQIDSLDGKIASQVSAEIYNTTQEALVLEKIGFLSAEWRTKKERGKIQSEFVYFPVECALVSSQKLPFVLEAGALEVFAFDAKKVFSDNTIYKMFYDVSPQNKKLKFYDGDATEGCFRMQIKDKRLKLFSKKSKSFSPYIWLIFFLFSAAVLLLALSKN